MSKNCSRRSGFAMDELAKTLRHFITRDLLYVVGGSAVALAFLHLFNRLPSTNQPTVYFVFLAGVGYVIGYAIQDGLGLTPLFTTGQVAEAGPVLKFLYARHTRSEWKPIQDIDLDQAYRQVNERAHERTLAELQRIITLRHIGTTMGSNSLVVAVLLTFRWCQREETFDLALAISSALLSLLLLVIAWIKSAQQFRFIANAFSTLPTKNAA